MTVEITPATPDDLDAMVALLLDDARARCARDPNLWKMADAAGDAIRTALSAALGPHAPPVRQQWLLARSGARVVGVAHSLLLPVPPIYAGEFGPPGLIMEDCHVAPGAPPETRRALLRAAEADLRAAGARVLLASGVAGGDWQGVFHEAGYAPLTAYLAKTGIGEAEAGADVRPACEDDVAGIVAASADSRATLERLHPMFWKPHEDAARRFGAWMTSSLTLDDRDMFVAPARGALSGYLVAQPATALHFPAAHDIAGIGIIDDFHHDDFADPARLRDGGHGAAGLLAAGEAAWRGRGQSAVVVVCPAAWTSKIALLESRGFRNAITWHIKPGT